MIKSKYKWFLSLNGIRRLGFNDDKYQTTLISFLNNYFTFFNGKHDVEEYDSKILKFIHRSLIENQIDLIKYSNLQAILNDIVLHTLLNNNPNKPVDIMLLITRAIQYHNVKNLLNANVENANIKTFKEKYESLHKKILNACEDNGCIISGTLFKGAEFNKFTENDLPNLIHKCSFSEFSDAPVHLQTIKILLKGCLNGYDELTSNEIRQLIKEISKELICIFYCRFNFGE